MKKSFFFFVLFTVLTGYTWAQQSAVDTKMTGYKPIDIRGLQDNMIKLVADDWMLVTSGEKTHFNTMTASWGGFGNLWNVPVSFIFIKPQRYTYQFIEKNQTYTLAIFDHEKYKEALNICGTKSGRDCDKVKLAGLTPIVTPSGMVSFSEARIIIECRVIYSDLLDSTGITKKEAQGWYKKSDEYHKMYAGEIIGVWVK